MAKKLLIIPAVSLLVFIFLNPSMNQFKEFIGKEKGSSGCRRTGNFLVYSIYESENIDNMDKYVGILSNFILLKPKINNVEVHTTIDSSRIADSIKATPLPGNTIDTFSVMDSIKVANL